MSRRRVARCKRSKREKYALVLVIQIWNISSASLTSNESILVDDILIFPVLQVLGDLGDTFVVFRSFECIR